MAALRNLVVSIFRMEEGPNVAAALRRCAAKPHHALSLIGAPIQ